MSLSKFSGLTLAALLLAGCSRRPEAAAPSAPVRRVLVSWYEVPEDSLAHHRAEPHEFTAAHNRLPLGTRVRLRNPENDKSVTVRITDRGIHNRRVELDLCKEAATELDVVHAGLAHVEMQELPAEK